MSKTPTPRVALTKESDDEIIDPFAYNWPILDTAVGARMVAAGVTPPSSELFDGCIVSEATTGKAWIARSDGIGGYTKQWLFYPYQIYCTMLTASVPNGIAPAQYTSFVYQASQSINAVAGDIISGRPVVPVTGIYEISCLVRWAPSGVGNFRSVGLSFNSNISVNELIKTEDNTPSNDTPGSTAVSGCSVLKKLGAGTSVSIGAWQNSGAALTMDAYLRVTLVKPL